MMESHMKAGLPMQFAVDSLGLRKGYTSLVPRPYILILLEWGLVREISMETIRVGISMEMPSFTMTSFQSARGQASSLEVLEWRH